MAYRRGHYRRAHFRRNRYGGYSYVKETYVSGHDFDKRGNAGNGGHIGHGNMNYKGQSNCFDSQKVTSFTDHEFDKTLNAGNSGHIGHDNMNYKENNPPKGCFYCIYESIWILTVLMIVAGLMPVPILAVIYIIFSIIMMVLPFIIENKKTKKDIETEHKNVSD